MRVDTHHGYGIGGMRTADSCAGAHSDTHGDIGAHRNANTDRNPNRGTNGNPHTHGGIHAQSCPAGERRSA